MGDLNTAKFQSSFQLHSPQDSTKVMFDRSNKNKVKVDGECPNPVKEYETKLTMEVKTFIKQMIQRQRSIWDKWDPEIWKQSSGPTHSGLLKPGWLVVDWLIKLQKLTDFYKHRTIIGDKLAPRPVWFAF